ncbi:hypothetical protein D3C85_1416430 [compost metagenome]
MAIEKPKALSESVARARSRRAAMASSSCGCGSGSVIGAGEAGGTTHAGDQLWMGGVQPGFQLHGLGDGVDPGIDGADMRRVDLAGFEDIDLQCLVVLELR